MKNRVIFRSRKLIVPLLAGIFAISLTGCIPSGNVVGKASLTTLDSSFANSGDMATIEINGGVIATPTGLRARLTKANFAVHGNNISANKFNDILESPGFSKSDFSIARLKGKNACGYAAGFTSDGRQFALGLISINNELNDILFDVYGIRLTADSQILVIEGDGFYWVGYAPAKSLKIGGRNLCGPL